LAETAVVWEPWFALAAASARKGAAPARHSHEKTNATAAGPGRHALLPAGPHPELAARRQAAGVRAWLEFPFIGFL
jgi:hypothetical protein